MVVRYRRGDTVYSGIDGVDYRIRLVERPCASRCLGANMQFNPASGAA